MTLLRCVALIRLRQRWRGCVVVALFLGVLLGVALFGIAGARRTQSSYEQFLRSVTSSDLSISREGFDVVGNENLASLADVVSARTYLGLRVLVYVDGLPDPSQFAEGVGSYDGAFFDQDRFVAREGRTARHDRADEVVVNEVAADEYGYRVGQHLDFGIVSPEAFDDPSVEANPPPALVRRFEVTIVGLGVFPDEVMEDDADRTARMLFTPAFTAGVVDAAFYNLQYIRLNHPASGVEAVQHRLRDVAEPGSVDVHYVALDRAHARRGLRPLSITLAVFGALAAGVGIALGSLAMIRLIRRDEAESNIFRVLGASGGATRACALVAPAASLVGACVIAVVVAVTLSPLMPLGPVGSIDRAGSIDVDLTVIGIGVLIAAIVVAAIVAVVTRRIGETTGERVSVRRRSRLVGAAAAAGVPPALTIGVGMTVKQDPGARGVPVRSVIAGTAIAVATLIIALGFATNLRTLTRDPHLYGWNWDVSLRAGQGFANLDPATTAAILDGDHDIDAWSAVYLGDDVIQGMDVPLLGMTPASGVTPPIIDGRFIANADEIVLGAATASSLHAAIGDTITIGAAPGSRDLRTVGIATLPSIGGQHVLHTSLGLGAIVAPERIPGFNDMAATAIGPQLAFVRFEPGSSHTTAVEHLRELTLPLTGLGDVDIVPAQRPVEIVSAASLVNAPLIVAGAFAVVMIVAFAVALFASVRRRRHDFAILRSLGFDDRQLTSTVMYHAYTIVAGGLLVGVPTGIIGSPQLWDAFADELDVVATYHAPALWITIVMAVTAAVATLAAIATAHSTRRLQPAAALREPQ